MSRAGGDHDAAQTDGSPPGTEALPAAGPGRLYPLPHGDSQVLLLRNLHTHYIPICLYILTPCSLWVLLSREWPWQKLCFSLSIHSFACSSIPLLRVPTPHMYTYTLSCLSYLNRTLSHAYIHLFQNPSHCKYSDN